MSIQQFNDGIIEEFRRRAGKVGGAFEGANLLLLTTSGARTGLSRTNPLMYFDDDRRYLIVASYAGAPANPPWYYNLVAHPDVSVEMGAERFIARAEVLAEPERTALFAGIAARNPTFAEYQRKTTRLIPVVALYRHETPLN